MANTTNLVIDAYFKELLRNVDSQTVSEIHIDPTGNWSTVKPNKTLTPKPEPSMCEGEDEKRKGKEERRTKEDRKSEVEQKAEKDLSTF
jgi:hypothetical protein